MIDKTLTKVLESLLDYKFPLKLYKDFHLAPLELLVIGAKTVLCYTFLLLPYFCLNLDLESVIIL